MEYEPVCLHKNTQVEWDNARDVKEQRFKTVVNSEYTLFIGKELHIGRAYCTDCQSYINDHDPAAIQAFDKLLSVKSEKEKRIKKHGTQVLVRN